MTLTELVGEGRERAALAYGCLRVRNLTEIHGRKSEDEKQEAVRIVMEHLGLNEEALRTLAIFADEYLTPESETTFLLGVLVGLYAIDYET